MDREREHILPARRRPDALSTQLRLLVADPVLWAMVLMMVLVCGWAVFPGMSHRPQLAAMWPIEVGTDLAVTIGAWRVARWPHLNTVQRRFWRLLGMSTLIFAVGDTAQSVQTLRDLTPDKLDGGAVQSTCLALGLILLIGTMLLYPSPERTWSEKVRFWLDSATVLIAGGVIAWYFGVRAAHQHGALINTVANAAIFVVAASAAVRIAISGIAPCTRLAATPMICAGAWQGLPALLAPAHAVETVTPGALVFRLAPSFLMMLGPRVQEVQARHDRSVFDPRSPQPYRLLPYVAVALTFGMLLVILPGRIGPAMWGVVVGAVLITGVVVTRQLLMFRENWALIGRLDRALLELRGHQRQLRDQATTDRLTGLLNRAAFVDGLAAALAGTHDPDGLCVLLVDLDDFKTVNDTLGHAAGDALLVAVARELLETLPPGGIVARLGGDEFAVLLTEGDGEAVAARMLAAIRRPLRITAHTLTVAVSIGIAPARIGDTVDDLMRNADIAMYAVKDDGKSGYRLYTPHMTARLLETARLGVRLREAIGADQFVVHYQPVVALRTRQLVGLEALIRWQHPEEGLIPPGRFVPIAEQTGLIVPLGRWVMWQACRQAVAWRRLYPGAESLVMSVNVAGRQLREPTFVGEVATALAETGLPPDRLTIEVTETAVLADGPAMQTLHDLRTLGVGLALDDFGTAASSLGLLLTCPVSTLKLDRSFVDGVVTSARQSAVATAVLSISRALDLNAVAEGVETEEQAEFLAGLGYSVAQGFLLGPPQPAQSVEQIWAGVDVAQAMFL
jgi:diguanylate cyclase (GGDEF)-like protein